MVQSNTITSDNYLYASVGENARDLANNSTVCKVG